MINIMCNRYQIDADWCYSSFSRYIKPQHRVLIIPLSFSDSLIANAKDWQKYYGYGGEHYTGIIGTLKAYGIAETSIDFINYFTDDSESAKSKIRAADMLYFPGGMPEKAVARIAEMGITDAISAYDGIVLGYSAGAMMQLKEYHITPDRTYPNYGYYTGLGLIDGFEIEVHYENTDVQNAAISRYIAERHKPVYAIGDSGAIICDSGKIETVGDVQFFSAE